MVGQAEGCALRLLCPIFDFKPRHQSQVTNIASEYGKTVNSLVLNKVYT
jgi:hypothetical protein